MENINNLNINKQVEGEADETFNNDLESINIENEGGSMEIRKGDTFKWKSPDAVPFRVRRIERINKDEIYFLFETQNSDGTWPIVDNIKERMKAKDVIAYLSSAEKIN